MLMKGCLLTLSLLSGCTLEVEDVSVVIESPLIVHAGQDFIIQAKIKNTDPSSTQVLVSIDLQNEYLQGVAVLNTEPRYADIVSIPFVGKSFVFNAPINAGGELNIVIHAQALAVGDYNSLADFCINSDYTFISDTLRTVVQPVE